MGKTRLYRNIKKSFPKIKVVATHEYNSFYYCVFGSTIKEVIEILFSGDIINMPVILSKGFYIKVNKSGTYKKYKP